VTLQIAFAALVLLVPGGKDVFDALGRGFVKLLEFTGVGTQPDLRRPVAAAKFGFIFAFQVLPTIIFFAALMGMLYHLGVMQWIVRGMAWAITKVMRVSGAETTSVCASVFIGQTEAPLTIRPTSSRMTQSELLTIMVGGMAPYRRRRAGRVRGHAQRQRSGDSSVLRQAPADRIDHGRAGDAGDLQDPDAGSGRTAHSWQGEDGSREEHRRTSSTPRPRARLTACAWR
jgi:hypothetical protein